MGMPRRKQPMNERFILGENANCRIHESEGTSVTGLNAAPAALRWTGRAGRSFVADRKRWVGFFPDIDETHADFTRLDRLKSLRKKSNTDIDLAHPGGQAKLGVSPLRWVFFACWMRNGFAIIFKWRTLASMAGVGRGGSEATRGVLGARGTGDCRRACGCASYVVNGAVCVLVHAGPGTRRGMAHWGHSKPHMVVADGKRMPNMLGEMWGGGWGLSGLAAALCNRISPGMP